MKVTVSFVCSKNYVIILKDIETYGLHVEIFHNIHNEGEKWK